MLDYQKADETLEFGEQVFASTLNLYRYALASAATRVERCKENEAASVPMLKESESAIDECGVPLGLYAAERLISTDLDADGARQYVRSRTWVNLWRAPVEAYLMRSLLNGATSPSSPEAEAALETLTAEIHASEQVLALAKDFQHLGPKVETLN